MLNRIQAATKAFRNPSLVKAEVALQQPDLLPRSWMETTFGPSDPIMPLPQGVGPVFAPREIDYPIAANATIQPRIAYGLMPFSTIKSTHDAIAEVALPVRTICREIIGFTGQLVDVNNNEITNHPLQWLVESPDREIPHDVWLTRFIKNTLIYDAGCFSIGVSNRNLYSLEYIDGSTLMLIINDRGKLPKPQEVSDNPAIRQRYVTQAQEWIRRGNPLPHTTPAFAQVVHGTPFTWWDQDQIWYRSQSRSMDTPYGECFIERAFAWINLVANITSFELAHYQTGNMPEGWASASADWSPERVMLWENTFNARMTSGPTERMRVRFLPAGFEYHDTKKPEFPQQLYDTASGNISNMIGLPPSEHGKIPGQGLGGKSFAQGQETTLYRNALLPVKTYIEDAFNEILRRFGVRDVRYRLIMHPSDPDPEKQQESIQKLFSAGIYTLNDSLSALGKNSVDGGDVHIIVSNGVVIRLEDYLGDNPKIDPVVQSADDMEQSKQVLQTAAKTGTVDGTKVFAVSKPGISKSEAQYTDTASNLDEICGKCCHFLGQGKCDVVQGTVLIGGWCKYFEAREPITKVQDSFELEKHCGVCPEDDAYFGALISREVSMPFLSSEHANGVDIVAMTPSGLPAKPALWKPEGEENPILVDRIGGPQYVREEAAYLIDRALGFMLVPVAYVADSYGENGAAIYYTFGMGPDNLIDTYSYEWLEKAAVFDCIIGQQDRGHHNWGTHPDDPSRMILFDNGLSFSPYDLPINSAFYDFIRGTELPENIIQALAVCSAASSTWQDILELVGAAAVAKAKARIAYMIQTRCCDAQ